MPEQRRGIGPFVATVAALAWSLAFAVWAYAGAAVTECIITPGGGETCRSLPLATRLGFELLAVLLPAFVCLVVWVLLRRYCRRGGWLARGAAGVLAGSFAVFCYLAALSIGVLLIPAALLLTVAVATTEPPS